MDAIVERNVETLMRDGVILRADVYRPATDEPVPVLLVRTPYNKDMAVNVLVLMAVDRGYAVVIQDTRGRWASDGDGRPFIHEKADGYDTVRWAAAQPWSNGRVGMLGGSYVGYTQYAAAAFQPPALRAIAPAVTFLEPHTAVFRNGVPTLGLLVSWGLSAQAQMAIMRLPDGPEKAQLMEALIEAVDGLSGGETFRHLPLETMPLIGRDGVCAFLYDMLRHTSPSRPYWQQIRVAPDEIRIPTLHIGGWYDIFTTQTFHDFGAIAEAARQAGRTVPQMLLVGPWYHGPLSNPVGEVDFGFRASDAYVLSNELQLRWFDAWLKDEREAVADLPPLRIFVMGENRWRDEETWPLARMRPTPYYFHSGGGANTLHGDGTLSPQAPSEEPVDSFAYDPRNPTPTRGGGLCCWHMGVLAPGAFDQREVEARPDVLVYTTPPLEADLEVTGPVEVHLWAATTAPDTDFTAKLVDVGPCGFARNVANGIVRARYRHGVDHEELVKPNTVVHYVIALNPTSNVFKAGHRIRVEIASSDFPAYARNPNTGGSILSETRLQPAVQTILHDADHPSHIVLPVIPR